MTDKELYRKTFSQVHAQREIRWEDMKVNKKKHISTRVVVLAAVIATLCALTVGAVATNFLSLGDLLLPKATVTPEGGTTPVPVDGPDYISLSGYMDSPESQALGEWQDFLNGYDEDESILRSVGNALDPALDRYSLYLVYTQEMGDKLDEICEKYGLKLHTDQYDCYAHPEALAACEGFAADNVKAYPMYMYEDGTFHCDGEAVIDGEIIDLQFRRSVKGTFNEVFLNVDDIGQYQQWNYQTNSGTMVLLALGSDKGLVLADLEDCFVTVNVLMGTDSGVTQADMEALADSFDYAKLSPVVEPVVDQETPAPTVDAPAREYFVQVLKNFYYDGLLPNGEMSEEYGKGPLSGENQFAVYDVDGDGEEELVVLYNTGSMAGLTGLVMAYDPDYTGPGAPLRTELQGSPMFTFYPGAVEVGWSHNQGMAGDALWPYDLYVYDQEQDRYSQFATVDAWDRTVSEVSWYDGTPFPEDVDADGDGIVYLVGEDVENGVSRQTAILDGPDYQAWRTALVGDISPLPVDFQPLTLDNINALLKEG